MKYRILKIVAPWPYMSQVYNPVLEMWIMLGLHLTKWGAKQTIGKHAKRNAEYIETNKFIGENLTKEV